MGLSEEEFGTLQNLNKSKKWQSSQMLKFISMEHVSSMLYLLMEYRLKIFQSIMIQWLSASQKVFAAQ